MNRPSPALPAARENHSPETRPFVLTIILIILVVLLLTGGIGYGRRGRRL